MNAASTRGGNSEIKADGIQGNTKQITRSLKTALFMKAMRKTSKLTVENEL